MVPGPLTGAPVLESSLSVPLSRLAVCLLAPMMQRRRDGPPSPPGGRVLRRPSYSVSLHCEIWAKNKVLMRCAAEGWLRFGLRSCSYQPPRKAPVASSDAPPPSVSSPLTSSCRFQAEKCQEPKRVPFSVSSGTRTAETVTADPLISVVGGGGSFCRVSCQSCLVFELHFLSRPLRGSENNSTWTSNRFGLGFSLTQLRLYDSFSR